MRTGFAWNELWRPKNGLWHSERSIASSVRRVKTEAGAIHTDLTV